MADDYTNGETAGTEAMEQTTRPTFQPDENDRKIFVGGLSWETTEENMRDYFAKYGEVMECNLKTDPDTGRSRGFGFVMFADISSITKVVNEPGHKLGGRSIDPKRAKARGGREPILKVFVGGLDPSTPEAEIRQHFETWGTVIEIDLPFDKQKNQRRAFCFVTFEGESIVDKVCERSKHDLGGKKVDVKKATPKEDQSGSGGSGFGGSRGGSESGGFRGRGGRGGRGRGGFSQQGGYSTQSYDQGYGGGYDQNYDYSGYDYSGYGGGYQQAAAGGGGWGSGYGQGGGGYSGQQSGYGKSPRGRGGSNGYGGGYHPYTR